MYCPGWEDIIWVPCFGGRCLIKGDSTRGATYLHFQNKAIASDFGKSPDLPMDAVCSEAGGQTGLFPELLEDSVTVGLPGTWHGTNVSLGI